MKSKIDKEGDIELAIEHCEARVAAKKRPRAEKKASRMVFTNAHYNYCEHSE